jgi:hypothetical protein
MLKETWTRLTTGAAVAAMLVSPALASAQPWKYIDPVPAGTTVQVRTTEPIDTQTMDGRVFRGIVENDVRDAQGNLAIPSGAIVLAAASTSATAVSAQTRKRRGMSAAERYWAPFSAR